MCLFLLCGIAKRLNLWYNRFIMREELLKKLSELNTEELEALGGHEADQRKLYTKPGRFIIERRTVSNISTGQEISPICLRSHPRFCGFPEHTHDYVEIMYVCSGSIVHNIGGKQVRVSAGDLLLLGNHAKHSIEPASESDIGVNIIISAELFEILLNTLRRDASLNTKLLESFLDKETSRHRVFKCAQSIEVQNLMESMIYASLFLERQDEYLSEQLVKMLVYHLCISGDTAAIAEELSYAEQTKNKILKYIRTSYSTATLTEAARLLGLSPTYLSRWICSSFNESFKELLMKERFSVAQDLLSTTDTAIGDIIIHIGYENSSYFHKEFKKRFGVTPKEYRKRFSAPPSKNSSGQ